MSIKLPFAHGPSFTVEISPTFIQQPTFARCFVMQIHKLRESLQNLSSLFYNNWVIFFLLAEQLQCIGARNGTIRLVGWLDSWWIGELASRLTWMSCRGLSWLRREPICCCWRPSKRKIENLQKSNWEFFFLIKLELHSSVRLWLSQWLLQPKNIVRQMNWLGSVQWCKQTVYTAFSITAADKPVLSSQFCQIFKPY